MSTVIDLGVSGKLVAPIEVEGKWYYFWDRNGDGNTANDGTVHDALDPIFNHDINNVTNSTVANADGLFGTTDVYRYATINGVQVALPTLGVTYPGNVWVSGTSASGTGTANNATYNDLLAIWDALNGTGTGTQTSGIPTGWQSGYYLTATAAGLGHADMAFDSGLVNAFRDDGTGTGNGVASVVLQVL